MADPLTMFLAAPPGLEPLLADEARTLGLAGVKALAGGVECTGAWGDVWRANLSLRGATRVLVRIASFPAVHLAQLDKRARALRWVDWLPREAAITVEATCRASKIYHSGAAAERVERAVKAALGEPAATAIPISLFVRIDRNICTVSIDSSGEPLYKRGFKQAVGKAPLRETMAALFLRACGYRGDEPVLDPMCGSGTLVIEAAEMALGLLPGRARDFAFSHLPSFDADTFDTMREGAASAPLVEPRFFGADRNQGAIEMAEANAARAGVAPVTSFSQATVRTLARPDGPAGLVIVNPPYGARIGDRKALLATYRTLGDRLLSAFAGWRVGLITSDDALARSTRLPFLAPGPPFPMAR